MPEHTKIAILGAGISGLATAFYLKKLCPAIDMTIFEQSDHVGGIIETHQRENQIFELGPRGIPLKGRGKFALEFIKDLGLWDQIILANPKDRQRYVYINSKLQKIPKNLFQAAFSPVTKGFFRALVKEYQIKPSDSEPRPDESIRSFAIRHFGEGLTQNLIEPLLTGIMAGDIDQLSLKAAFPQLDQLEQKYGSVVKGFLHQKKMAKSSYDPVFLKSGIISFKKGMGQLVAKAAEHLSDHLELSAKITQIRKRDAAQENSGYQIFYNSQICSADIVISTLPAYTLATVIKEMSMELSHSLNQIKYVPIALVSLAYQRKVNTYKGFGYLVASKENQAILGTLWNDQTFPEHYKTKGSCFTVMLGGARFQNFNQFDDDYFIQQAADTLKAHLKIKEDPYFMHCKRLPKAMPQYTIDHLERIEAIHEGCPHNFYISGNFCGGIGISDIIRVAKNNADLIMSIHQSDQLSAINSTSQA